MSIMSNTLCANNNSIKNEGGVRQKNQHARRQGVRCKTRKARKLMLSIVACACAIVLGAGAIIAYASPLTPDYSWYKGHESESNYQISTASQMLAFSNLVNGTAVLEEGQSAVAAVTFANKTLTLTQDINFLGYDNGLPCIGGQGGTVFAGTFDGAGKRISGCTLISGDDAKSNIGLFGACTAESTVKNFTVSSMDITLENSTSTIKQFENIGLIVGSSEGNISDITTENSCVLTITSTPDATSEIRYPILNVGGIAGIVKGDISGCSNNATVNITNKGKSWDENDLIVAAGVGGIVGCSGDMDTSITSQIGKPNGYKQGNISNCTNSGAVTVIAGIKMGDSTYSPNMTGAFFVGGIAGYAKSNIDQCSNSGFIKCEDGQRVAGIVGSFRASVAQSGANGGSVEGNDAKDADGNSMGKLTISQCKNTGDVFARVCAGGIAGQTGCDSLVIGCQNGDFTERTSTTYIMAGRPNKPYAGGIAGQIYGSVCFCANYGSVATAIMKDLSTTDITDDSQITLQAGYYTTGIVAGARALKDDDGNLVSESNIYANINMGLVKAINDGNTYKQRHICGDHEDKEGIMIYDNIGVKGMVTGDEIAFVDDGKMSGINLVVSADQLKDTNTTVHDIDSSLDDSRTLLAALNTHAIEIDYKFYYQQQPTNSAKGAGFPGLNVWLEGSQSLDLSTATFTQTSPAGYLGISGAVPKVTGSLDGTTLYQDVDFYVVAQDGAIEKTDPEKPYTGTVVGMGVYSGTASVQYGIGNLNLSDCSVELASAEFDWTHHEIKSSDIVVKNAAGTVLDQSQYVWNWDHDRAKKDISTESEKQDYDARADFDENGNPAYASMYEQDYVVRISAAPGADATGELYTTYKIGRASLKYESSTAAENPEEWAKKPQGVKVGMGTSFEQTYQSSRQISEKSKEISATFPYTGHPIRPQLQFDYLGNTLYYYYVTDTSKGEIPVGQKLSDLSTAQRTNYLKVSAALLDSTVYPDGQIPDEYAKDEQGNLNNVGSATSKKIGGIFIESAENGSGAKTNFSSNDAMLFYIDPSIKPELSDVNVTLEYDEHDYVSGNTYEPSVTVDYLGSTLDLGTDYTVSYTNNDRLGTALVTIKPGSNGIFTEEKTVTFQLTPEREHVTWHYDWKGADETNNTVAVTGLSYDTIDAFDAKIPETVEHDGKTYTVTSIAPSAFRGLSSSSIKEETDDNGYTIYVSGTQTSGISPSVYSLIKSVTIPNTVTKIGEAAFKANDNTSSNISKVSFADPMKSQCKVIDADAFSLCNKMTEFTVPASVIFIGPRAFQERDASAYKSDNTLVGLQKLVFLTKDANALPYLNKNVTYSEGLEGICCTGNRPQAAFANVGFNTSSLKMGPEVYYYPSATTLSRLIEANSKDRTVDSSGKPTDTYTDGSTTKKYSDVFTYGGYWNLHQLESSVSVSFKIDDADKAKTTSSTPAALTNQEAGTTIDALPSLTPASGYSFRGWKDSEGNVYEIENAYTVPMESVELTAVFGKSVNINFAAADPSAIQDGGLPENLTNVAAGKVITLTAPTLKEGYVFDGYSDGQTTWQEGNYTVPDDVDTVTLTAQTSKTVDITLTVPQNLIDTGVVVGDIPSNLTAQRVGSQIALPTVELSSNYRQLGWSDGTTTYPAGIYTVPDSNQTLTLVVDLKPAVTPIKAAYGSKVSYNYDYGSLKASITLDTTIGIDVISMQWYGCDSYGKNEAIVAGATSTQCYAPAGLSVATYYYKCKVLAKLTDGSQKTFESEPIAAEVQKASNSISIKDTTITSTQADFEIVQASFGQDKAEFGYSLTNDPASVATWQSTPSFTNLTKGQSYYAFARIPESDNYRVATSTGIAFTAGDPITVTFDCMADVVIDGQSTTQKQVTVNCGTLIDQAQVPVLDNLVGWYSAPQCKDDQAFDIKTQTLSADTTLYARYETNYQVTIEVASSFDAKNAVIYRSKTFSDSALRDLANDNEVVMQWFKMQIYTPYVMVTRNSVSYQDLFDAAGSEFTPTDDQSIAVWSTQTGWTNASSAVRWGDLKTGKFYPDDTKKAWVKTNPRDVVPSFALSCSRAEYSETKTAQEAYEEAISSSKLYWTQDCLRSFKGIYGEFEDGNSSIWGFTSGSNVDTIRIVVPSSTITFDVAQGSSIDAQTVETGQLATKPADPTKPGYSFAGWYKDAACSAGQEFNFDTDTITEDITLHAKWEEAVITVEATGASGVYGYGANEIVAQASATTASTATPSYQWYDASTDEAISGATAATYALPVGKNADTYSVYCKATLGSSTATSNTVDLVVSKAASTIALDVNPVSSYSSTTATLADAIKTGSTKDIEYALSTDETSAKAGQAPESGWQTSTSFTGLAGDTTYYIWARVQADTNYEEAVLNTPASFKTYAIGKVQEPSLPQSVDYNPSSTLQSAAPLTGNWAWAAPDTVPVPDNGGYIAIYTPTDLDTTDYSAEPGWDENTKTVYRTLALTVNKLTASLDKAPSASTLAYGQPVSDSVLSGGSVKLSDGSALAGSFEWSKEDVDKVLGAGTHTMTVTFVASDGRSANYNTVSAEIELVVTAFDIANGTIAEVEAQLETGNAICPEPQVTGLDGAILTAGTDFNYSYSNNIEPGTDTATITVEGIGNYTGTKSINFTITARWKRLSGGTALTTMKKIINEGWETSDWAVLATSKGYQDALCASGLAGLLNAPVLMTEPSKLSSQTKSLLETKQVKKVAIVGGTAAISDTVKAEVQKMGIDVWRVSGGTAASTSTAVYDFGLNYGGWGSDAVVATCDSFQDALSIASYSYCKKAPILLTDKGKKDIRSAVQKRLNNGSFTRTLIIGGTAAVSEAVETKVVGAKRLSGGTAYSTNTEVANFCLEAGMEVSHMGVARGDAYQDALAGAALLGKQNSVLILADDNTKNSKTYNITRIISKNKKDLEANCYIFGGTGAVSENVEALVKEASKL